MKKILHLFQVVRRNWESDPSARGATRMVLGALLIFEAVFGVVQETFDGKRNSNKGLLSAVLGVIIGAGMVVFHGWLAPEEDYAEPRPITGEIVEIDQVRDSDGDRMYKPVYGYRVDGEQYTVVSIASSSMKPSLGAEVDLVYDAAQPSIATRTDGIEGNLDRIVFWIGMLILVTSIFALAIDVLMISIGIHFLLKGRRERMAVDPEDRPGFMESLGRLWTDLSSGRRSASAVLAQPLDEATPR